ncbi:glycosyltransferase family 9 protein [Polynucleobacter sp. MWH-UH23A]|uniref:glycosyltransferase family 9 protein n=1 Tax=Polynucleobacter sp. MWH-UH23A TaxID=1855613 RepID=UPI003364BA88
MNKLIFRVGSIGDSVVSLPAFHSIKEKFINDKVYLLCDDHELTDGKAVSSYKIFEFFNLIDGYFTYEEKSKYKNLFSLRKFVLLNNISTVYYLMPSRSFLQKLRDYIFFRILGLEIIGIDLFSKDENLYLKNARYEPESARLLRKLNFKSANATQILKIKSNIHANKEVTIAIGTKHKVNDWGLENWYKLVSRLAEVPTIKFNFIGGPDDYEPTERLCSLIKDRYSNYCGISSIADSIATIGRSNLFIGHDSGPMHLASLTSAKIIAIYSGKNPPGIWYPQGKNINIYRADDVKSIEPDVIFEIANKLIDE